MINPNQEAPSTEQITPKTMEEVQRIEKSDSKLQRRVDIKQLVEEPLISACEMLYDLNICTWRSSCANPDDFKRGAGVIDIDFPSLSTHNKIVAEQLVNEGKAEFSPRDNPLFVILIIPFHDNSPPSEVSDRARELATRFSKQKMSWVTSYTLEEMRRKLNSPKMSPEEITRETHLFFDNETQTFFVNEEQCIKAKEKVI